MRLGTNVDSTDGDMFLHYVQLSKTACMLLSVPGSSAQSERGVGRLRRTAVAARNMLSEKALEQEVVCSHFINSDFYSFSKLLKKVAEIQSDLTHGAPHAKTPQSKTPQ